MTILGTRGSTGDLDGTSTTSTTSSIDRQTGVLLLVIALADLLTIGAATLLAWDLRLNLDVVVGMVGGVSPQDPLPLTAAPWIVATWMVLLAAQGAYAGRLIAAGTEEFKLVVLGSVITAGTVGMACYLFQIPLSRGFVLLTFLLGIPMLIAERYAVRKVVHLLRRQGRYIHRVVAVGGPEAVEELVDVLHRERYVGYEIVGACVPAELGDAEERLSVPYLGRVADTRRVSEQIGADTVLVARGGYSSSADLRRIAWSLEGSDLDLVVVPSLTDVAGPRIHMRPVAGLPLLHVEGPQIAEAGGFAKRAFDIVVAGLALAVLSPLMIAVAVLVKAHDGGPVFFRQRRVGRDGHYFGMLKFRSMVVDAERRLDEVRHLNESDGLLFKSRNDPRITPTGRWLRRFSVDEFPQLLNVLKGEMSLVGPRPPLPSEADAYGDDVRRRLLVRPGMTGLWQVSGRSGLSWSETVRLDLYYVDNWSMVTDLVIMAKTVRAVFGAAGAY